MKGTKSIVYASFHFQKAHEQGVGFESISSCFR